MIQVVQKTIFIFFIMLLIVDSVSALDVITGKVRLVDRKNKVLVIAPLNKKEEPLTIQFEKGRIPFGLKRGDIVRIRGDFAAGKEGAILISPKIWCSRPDSRGFDKTGVRRRLFHGRDRSWGLGHRGPKGSGKHGRR